LERVGTPSLSRRRSPGSRWGVRILAAWLVLTGTACRPAPPPPPPSRGPDIVRRHWDQVCRPQGRAPAAPRVTELFDTAGLGSQLQDEGLRVPTRVGRTPHVDFVSRYQADGRLLASGLWESTVDPAAANGIAQILRSRARSPIRLLQPEGFRVRLSLTPWPVLALASAIECVPHMVHRDGRPPVGLPDTVRTWAGGAHLGEGNDTTVTVNILIDERGRVLEVTRHAGSDHAVDAARDIIGQLRFDPPLRNGEPIRAWLRQSFRFRRSISD
jgi:hypothetical protein